MAEERKCSHPSVNGKRFALAGTSFTKCLAWPITRATCSPDGTVRGQYGSLRSGRPRVNTSAKKGCAAPIPKSQNTSPMQPDRDAVLPLGSPHADEDGIRGLGTGAEIQALLAKRVESQ